MYIETNENRNATCQNLQDTSKAVLRGKITVIKACSKKKKKLKETARLNLTLNKLDSKVRFHLIPLEGPYWWAERSAA